MSHYLNGTSTSNSALSRARISSIISISMGPQNPKYSRHIKDQNNGGLHIVIRPVSERWNRQVLCKEEYRRSGPCNVLSVTKVREIPKDLEASLAASQSKHQALRESDVEE
ncbi:hypothetical protein EV424DRAFT_1354149 [Suillus variegatus]|nr:hypothetical protein EV424DRAFT_1354149 [Suillus variegatus]